jgi:hypothetical protein
LQNPDGWSAHNDHLASFAGHVLSTPRSWYMHLHPHAFIFAHAQRFIMHAPHMHHTCIMHAPNKGILNRLLGMIRSQMSTAMVSFSNRSHVHVLACTFSHAPFSYAPFSHCSRMYCPRMHRSRMHRTRMHLSLVPHCCTYLSRMHHSHNADMTSLAHFSPPKEIR